MPNSSFTFPCCSPSRNPTKQVPSPSDQAINSICCIARPASSPGLKAFSMTTAIASGASEMNGPWVAMLPKDLRMLASLITTKCQGCELLELGDHRAACIILYTMSSGMGSGLKFLTVLRVLIQSNSSKVSISAVSTPRGNLEGRLHRDCPPFLPAGHDIGLRVVITANPHS